MGTRISSEKMVSNTQRRITDGTINAQMPRMPAHVLSRQKSCRGRRIGGHVRGGRGFIPFQYLTAQPGTNRLGHVRRIDAPPIGHWGRLPGGGQPGSRRCAGGTRWLFGLEQSIGSWRITGLQRDRRKRRATQSECRSHQLGGRLSRSWTCRGGVAGFERRGYTDGRIGSPRLGSEAGRFSGTG